MKGIAWDSVIRTLFGAASFEEAIWDHVGLGLGAAKQRLQGLLIDGRDSLHTALKGPKYFHLR